ncbi:MAG TPA: hypothetical protein VHE12_04490 [bacterium]|nr:hypothetical protein [bacterium]
MAGKKSKSQIEGPLGFSIGEALGFAWNAAAKHLGLMVAIAAILFALDLLGGGFELVAKRAEYTWLKVVAELLRLILMLPVTYWVTAGIIVVALKLVAEEDARFEDLFPGLGKTWAYFFGSLVLGLVFVFGLLLLVVPGVILVLRYMFAPYLMLDRGLKLREAFDLSARMTDGQKGHLFGYGFVCLGVMIAGLCACCIGVFWSVLLVQIASVFIYRKLLVQTDPELA